MLIKKILYRISILCLLIIQSFYVYADKRISLKLQIDPGHHVYKPLRLLTKQMEKTARIYKTNGHVDYWEQEARKSIQKMLQSYGYYESIIEVKRLEIEEKNNILTFVITPGDRYRIKDIKLKFVEGSNQLINMLNLKDLHTKIGDYVDVRSIEDDQELILKYLEENNCLLGISVSHQAIIDHYKDCIQIVFLIYTGPEATIEKFNLKGLKNVNEQYARKLINVENGSCFRRSTVLQLKNDLQKSNLFAFVKTSYPSTPNSDGSVPVLLKFEERKMRSIKLGGSYGTDFGFGGNLSWRHRNLFGNGEVLKVTLDANNVNQSFELKYMQSFLGDKNQKLRIENKYEREISQSFDNKEVNTAVFIDRNVNDWWNIGIGGKLSYSNVRELSQENNPRQQFTLFSIPAYIELDGRDNIVDSRNGYFARFEATPYNSINLKIKPFIKLKTSLHTYYTLKDRVTIALKAATGVLFAQDNREIPISEKFFVGGSNSLRGYGYHLASDINDECRPIGGKSLLELSAELRFRLKNNLGLVTFIDGGYAYQNEVPKKDNLLYGVGVGLRYYTDFGPLRIDVAVPMKRRSCGLDKSMQYYFGIGQSF